MGEQGGFRVMSFVLFCGVFVEGSAEVKGLEGEQDWSA